jgi:hypothetical protein
VGPEGVDANKFDFLAKGVIPCVFFFQLFSGPTDDDDSIIESDSQELLIESILECEEYIANLESIHVQQSKLLDSTLFDANRIGMH